VDEKSAISANCNRYGGIGETHDEPVIEIGEM